MFRVSCSCFVFRVSCSCSCRDLLVWRNSCSCRVRVTCFVFVLVLKTNLNTTLASIPNGVIKHADFKYDILVVSLRRVAPNTSEQRSRSGLCKRVIRREATETEGLVNIKSAVFNFSMLMGWKPYYQ